ncbi:MAG: glycoside hydrolase family 43 protein [Candidatus Marinimicrobia bacterium]|nr:glycoside hydrolase family 43 protein [Candidatus Neomarinimicrobiota bacterium]
MRKIIYLLILLSTELFAQESSFFNPILPGGYPDPSICRVGNDYYIVNSSFEYFPGLPIHHSEDLVNWELVGYGLHREDQCNIEVNLVDVQSNGGIHAPTIRYHNGTFYIITTNVYSPKEEGYSTKFVNFIITAKNIEGPWSEPHILEGAPGIDPDIFFDDDGKVWYVGTHSSENPNFPGEGEIWLQEIDLENWKLKGERYYLWRGACGGIWVEGPHMYKKDGIYYLMVAEGGTSFNHAVMIALSDDVRGPYISNARNPILSSRHLFYDHWVNSTSHADMVELPDGRWYMVALGIRGDEERRSNMGRETHLIPVIWEREPFEWKEVKYEWPVCAPITGKVERLNPLPFENKAQIRNDAFVDNFNSEKLNLEWNFRRVPQKGTYSITERDGYLRLFAKPDVIKERERCSLMGIRQKESDFEYCARMIFESNNEAFESGVSLFQKDDNYFTFTVIQKNRKYLLQLKLAEPNKSPEILKEKNLEEYVSEIIFKVVSKEHSYHFMYSLDNGETFTSFANTKVNHILSKGYTGAYLGLYCTSNGQQSKEYADFDWVQYKGFQRFTNE